MHRGLQERRFGRRKTEFWTRGRPPLPYGIVEGLPVIRPESVASVTGVCKSLLNGRERAQITTELNSVIDHAKCYQCHVVALGRACGECVGCLYDPRNDV